MYKKQGRRLLNGTAGAALVASVAMVGGSFALATGAASADTTTTSGSVPVTTVPAFAMSLSQIQARAALAITNRVNALGATITVVEGDSSFLGTDGTTLVTNMQADISALQALGTKIAGDTTVAQARADFRSIFTQFRIYWFVIPDAKLVVRSDHATSVALPAVQKTITALQGELTGGVPADAVKLVANANWRAGKASTALTGVPAQLLGYTAADWDANHNLLATDKGAVKSAEWDLDLARVDLAKARFDIEHYNRRHHGHGTAATPTSTTVAPTTTTTSPTTSTTS